MAASFLFLFKNGSFEGNKKIPEEACIYFAKKIERSINQSDPTLLNDALDYHSFLKKVANNLGPYNKIQLVNLSVQVKENIRFGDMVMGYLKSSDGYFNFTKLYYQNRVPHIIFRIYSQMEGLNYFDCEIDRINGNLNITDVFIYYAGELWSTSYFRHMKLLAEYNKGDLENIHPENEFHNSLIKIAYIKDLLLLDQPELAEQIYLTIPRLFQNDKFFQGTALKIAFRLSDSAYVMAIDQYISSDLNNEPFNLFFNLLRSLATKDNSKVRQSITALNELTGQDSLMQLFIGQTFQNEHLYEKAIKNFENTIDRYPDLFETYWYKMVSLIQTKQYQKAVDFLDIIIINFEARKIDFEDLLAEYPSFINSEEFLRWRNMVNI